MINVIHRKPRLQIELEEAIQEADDCWTRLMEGENPFPNNYDMELKNRYMAANHRVGILLTQINCSHKYEVDTVGSMHLTAGEVWDDIRGICSRCGVEV
jgi:hypothetical protein